MQSRERNYGIELLRILAMYMIVINHVIGMGAVYASSTFLSPQYEAQFFLHYLVFSDVNIFALISGYVGYDSRFKVSSLANVWARTLFYSIGMTVVFALIYPGTVGGKQWLDACFPVMTGQYWYVTAYVVLFFFIPILQAAVRNLPRKTLRLAILATLILLSLGSFLMRGEDLFRLHNGYSAWWLLVMYLVGAYIKKYNPFRKIRPIWGLVTFFAMVLCCFGGKLLIEVLGYRINGSMRCIYLFDCYTNPFFVAAGVGILHFFSSIHPGKKACRIIGTIAPLAFSVYLIHMHTGFKEQILLGRLAWLCEKPLWMSVPIVFGAALAIFVFALAVDWCRSQLFRLIRIPALMKKLDHKLALEEKE